MEIPYKSIEKNTLKEILKEIVTRDGTDYGAEETSTDEKISSVMNALKSETAYLYWDDNTETVSLHLAEDRPVF